MNMRQNLLLCMDEQTATAHTFEQAIKEEGLTMEIIALISEYYKKDISQEEKTEAQKRCNK